MAEPLFYRRPAPFSAQAHAQWRLKDGDLAFAAGTNAVPLVIGEFASCVAGPVRRLAFATRQDRSLALCE